CTRFAGGAPVPIAGDPRKGFAVDPGDIARAVTPRTRAILLNYPNNPTGMTLDELEISEIADIARRCDFLVIADEIYSELVYSGRHVSIATLPGMRERTLVLNGFSKAFAMTGWRLGYAAGPATWVSAMHRIHQYSMLCAPMPSQQAALEALRHGKPDMKEMVRQYEARGRFFAAGLRALGFPCPDPEGAFYCFPSIRPTGLSSDDFAERLLHEERVAVIP